MMMEPRWMNEQNIKNHVKANTQYRGTRVLAATPFWFDVPVRLPDSDSVWRFNAKKTKNKKKTLFLCLKILCKVCVC